MPASSPTNTTAASVFALAMPHSPLDHQQPTAGTSLAPLNSSSSSSSTTTTTTTTTVLASSNCNDRLKTTMEYSDEDDKENHRHPAGRDRSSSLELENLLSGSLNVSQAHPSIPAAADPTTEALVALSRSTPMYEYHMKPSGRSALPELRESRDWVKEEVVAHLDGFRHAPSHVGCLYPGARFTGEQRSGRQSYSVQVVIQDVDLENSYLCGYLNIKGLTDEFPELTTFFDAEIIGDKFGFLTRKWDASEHVDRQHWMKFPAFRPFEPSFNDDDFSYDYMSTGHMFMRWKEHFLVPNHQIQNVNGASFAGFYYVAFDLTLGNITGFYYHQNSELFQHLMLKHVPEKSLASFEFR